MESVKACGKTSSKVNSERILTSNTPSAHAAQHTFLVTFLTSAVYYERGAIVAASIATDEQRVRFFAVLNALVAACTLAAQLLLAGHCLGRLGTAALLLFEPVVLLLGLLTFALSPGLIEIAPLDGV